MKEGRNEKALATLTGLESRFAEGLEKRPRVAAQFYFTKSLLLGKLGRRPEAREAFRRSADFKRRAEFRGGPGR